MGQNINYTFPNGSIYQDIYNSTSNRMINTDSVDQNIMSINNNGNTANSNNNNSINTIIYNVNDHSINYVNNQVNNSDIIANNYYNGDIEFPANMDHHVRCSTCRKSKGMNQYRVRPNGRRFGMCRDCTGKKRLYYLRTIEERKRSKRNEKLINKNKIKRNFPKYRRYNHYQEIYEDFLNLLNNHPNQILRPPNTILNTSDMINSGGNNDRNDGSKDNINNINSNNINDDDNNSSYHNRINSNDSNNNNINFGNDNFDTNHNNNSIGDYNNSHTSISSDIDKCLDDDNHISVNNCINPKFNMNNDCIDINVNNDCIDINMNRENSDNIKCTNFNDDSYDFNYDINFDDIFPESICTNETTLSFNANNNEVDQNEDPINPNNIVDDGINCGKIGVLPNINDHENLCSGTEGNHPINCSSKHENVSSDSDPELNFPIDSMLENKDDDNNENYFIDGSE